MPVVNVNNFSTVLGSALASSTPGTTGQSLVVATGFGAQFPAIAAPNFAYLTITDGTNTEIVQVTAHTAASDTFTVTRGYEGVGTAAATAPAWATPASTTVEARANKALLDNAVELDADETITGTKTLTKPLQLTPQSSNPAAVAGQLQVYSRNLGGKYLPKWVGPAGVDTYFQEAIWGNNNVVWKPGAAAAFTFLGDTPTVTGTITRATPAAGSFGAEMNRQIITTAATLNTSVGLLGASAAFARIVALGHGGFFLACRFRLETMGLNTSYRLFIGLSSIAALPTTVEPSALAASQIGIGFDAADTTLQVMRKDGTTAQKISVTGSAKTAGNTYDFMCFCPPGNGTVAGNIFYRVDDVNAGTTLVSDISTGVSTNAPLASTMMRPIAFVGTLTSVAQAVSLSNYYASADY
jgi:hypothetical protein